MLRTEYDLVIDPEIRDHLPPAHEFSDAELEVQLISTKGAADALVVGLIGGKRFLVDGHRRYAKCQKLGLPYDTREIEFASKQDALDWMDSYQLSRRNLGKNDYMLAIRRRHDYFARTKGHNAAKLVAAEQGVTERQVYRAVAFGNALDSLADDIQRRIKSGEVKASKQDVVYLASLDELHQRRILNQLDSGEYDSLRQVLHGTTDENGEGFEEPDDEGWSGSDDAVVEATETVDQEAEPDEDDSEDDYDCWPEPSDSELAEDAGDDDSEIPNPPAVPTDKMSVTKPPAKSAFDYVDAAQRIGGKFVGSLAPLKELDKRRYRDIYDKFGEVAELLEAWRKEVE